MSEEKNGPGPRDPEMSKRTEIREDPQANKETVATGDPEMDVDTQYREGPAAGDDPGSIEFQVESVAAGDDAEPSLRAAHVVRVATGAGKPASVTRYELRDELGAGGMAIVTAAWDDQLQRSVAVKRLRRELATSPRPPPFLSQTIKRAGPSP